MEIRSPKLPPAKAGGESLAYKYYAGYSTGFVEDVLAKMNLDTTAVVGDPWNGSGTTTYVVKSEGLSAKGFDLSPALVMLAKARLVDPDVLKSVEALKEDVIFHAKSTEQELSSDEPFSAWFNDDTSVSLRALERSIFNLLVSAKGHSLLSSAPSLRHVSHLASLFYVALFRTVRSFLSRFQTTNPTWIKLARNHAQLESLARASHHDHSRA